MTGDWMLAIDMRSHLCRLALSHSMQTTLKEAQGWGSGRTRFCYVVPCRLPTLSLHKMGSGTTRMDVLCHGEMTYSPTFGTPISLWHKKNVKTVLLKRKHWEKVVLCFIKVSSLTSLVHLRWRAFKPAVFQRSLLATRISARTTAFSHLCC